MSVITERSTLVAETTDARVKIERATARTEDHGETSLATVNVAVPAVPESGIVKIETGTSAPEIGVALRMLAVREVRGSALQFLIVLARLDEITRSRCAKKNAPLGKHVTINYRTSMHHE